jgi:hypothetical protein
VTAGNASGINDGAAAVMVMTAKKAAALGLTPLARIAAFGTSGLDPATMGMGPVPASQKALARAGWKASDVDLFGTERSLRGPSLRRQQGAGHRTRKRSTSTAVPSPSVTLLVRPVAAFWSRCCTKCSAATPRRASRLFALAAAWGFPSHWNVLNRVTTECRPRLVFTGCS